MRISRRPRITSYSTGLLAVLPAALYAAAPAAEIVSVSRVASLVLGLLVVLAVFLLLVLLLKKLSGTRGPGKGNMQLIDTMHLGSKERLVIVRVIDEYLLLGVSAQGINRLEALPADGFNSPGEEAGKASGFERLLSRAGSAG